MKAEKTNHLFDEIMSLTSGHYSELKNKEVTLRHINASCKEIELIECKADKWDEKETPFATTEQKFIRNYDENLVGKCKCGNKVYEHTKYCCDCGQKLKWERESE